MAHEQLRLLTSNTNFARLLGHKKSMDLLLPPNVPTLAGFSEVGPGRRHLAEAAITSRGYQAIFPADTDMDTVWALSPGLNVVSTRAIQFRPGLQSPLSLVMGDKRRTIGLHGIVIATPTGRHIRVSQQHLSPPILEPLRRPQARKLRHTLANDTYFAPASKIIDINFGDNNHYPRPSVLDLEAYDAMGFMPVLTQVGTCDVNDTHPLFGAVLRSMGLPTFPQLDAAYVRPPKDNHLVLWEDANDAAVTALGLDTVGCQVRLLKVDSDHRAIELVLSIP